MDKKTLELYAMCMLNMNPFGLYQCTIVSSSGMKFINKLRELVLSKATWVNSEIFILLFTSSTKTLIQIDLVLLKDLSCLHCTCSRCQST